jgi:hypothetical protein
MAPTLSSTVINLSRSTFGINLLAPPQPPKYDTMSYTSAGMVKNNPPQKPRKAHRLPVDGRDLRTLNASQLLADDPYSSEEDEVGIVTATKEVRDICFGFTTCLPPFMPTMTC